MRAVLLLAVLVATSPNAIAQAPEPKYEGKPLAYWIDRFQKAENEKDRIEAVKSGFARLALMLRRPFLNCS